MNIDIPSHQERILERYKTELEYYNCGFKHEILHGDLQTNYKEHRWLTYWIRNPDLQDPSDELWDFMSELYLRAGWLLEKDWGEEDEHGNSKLQAIKLFVANPEVVAAAKAKYAENNT